MARTHARVAVAIWQDPEFIALDDDAQRLYMLLLSQPKLSLCGTIDLTPGRWARLSPSTSTADIETALEKLHEARFVVVDHASEELVMRSFVRHDGVLDSPNLVQAMWKAWTAVHSKELRRVVVDELPDLAFVPAFGSDKPSAKGYEPPPDAVVMRSSNPSENPSPNPSATPGPSPSPSPSPGPAPGAAPLASVDEPIAEHVEVVLAPSAPPPATTGESSQTIVAGFLDWCDQQHRPRPGKVGLVAQSVKTLLDAGHPPADIKRALTETATFTVPSLEVALNGKRSQQPTSVGARTVASGMSWAERKKRGA